MPSTARPARSRRRPLIHLSLIWTLLALAAPAAILAQPAEETPGAVGPDGAGAGTLLRVLPGRYEPLPVLDIDVRLEVTGLLVHGTVTESFLNPGSETIEAIYVFPLPERAAVHHMEMRIGSRRIVSVIRERQEAQRVYDEAKKEGRKAALLTERRPNLFTAAAANINPDERVDVTLEYVQELTWTAGEFSLAFPLTFTPRFLPPGSSAGAAGVQGGPAAAAGDETPAGGLFAPARDPAAPRARLAVRLHAGLPIASVESPSHPVRTSWEGDVLLVEPREPAVVADRDFTLRWRIGATAAPQPAAYLEDRADGRYLLLMVVPPADDLGPARGLPTETVFVVDVSGSMNGPSIEAARAALRAALGRLRPGDSFGILAFDDRLYEFQPAPIDADPPAVAAARAWVEGLQPGGGTMIAPALARALEMARAGMGDRVRRIVFLTDGAVDNEAEVLRMAHGDLGGTRLNILGIGPAPNRFLMSELAGAGRGLCDFIGAPTEAGSAIDAFFERLDRPVMTDLRLEWSGVAPAEIYPDPLPDLHAGEPLLVSARLATAGPAATTGSAALVGRVPGRTLRFDLPLEAKAPAASGVAIRWARARVASLLDARVLGADPEEVRKAVIEVSRSFDIVTPFTSLVAVEEFPTARADARGVQVPNGLPAGFMTSGELPRTGSDDPALFLLGCLLSLAGVVLIRIAAAARPRA